MANSDTKTLDRPKREEAIAKLKEIQIGFKQNLANLHLKLEMLDSKPELQSCLDNLKQDVESRASDLEAEVKRLREDLKSIRELLGLNLEKQNSGKS
jgi:LPS O-antigen subunit length determinant protein (WzzB/FepE family)